MVEWTNADASNMYANVFSFLGLPFCEDIETSTADLAILGLPYDLATSGRPGTRSGPNAIRQASANLRWEEARWPWNFSLRDRLQAVDCGDISWYQGNHEEFVAQCERKAGDIIDSGKTLLSLGGDHYVALPLLRRHVKRYGKLALIHFDAHTDTDEDGWIFDHGAMFHHARVEGLLDEQRSVQIGIRTWYEADGHPFTVLDADWACGRAPAAARVTWVHLGQNPNLFALRRNIGLVSPDDPSITEDILMRIDNAQSDQPLFYTRPDYA